MTNFTKLIRYKPMKSLFLTLFSISFLFNTVYSQNAVNVDPLIVFRNEQTNTCGYKNLKGELVIPNKYTFCYTDTLHNYAAVLDSVVGWIAIDKNDFQLYQIFMYDNGPDYPSEGLFRIVIDELIGYADAETGKVVIAPQYRCAYPFENGTAKVAVNCRKIQDEDYYKWESQYWYHINTNGKRIVMSKN